MVKARHNLALVLEADRMAGCEHDRAGGSRLTSADVIVGGQAYKMSDSTGGELARTVGACAASKPPVQGHADIWGDTARNTASLQGVQHQLQPCTFTVSNQ